MSAVPVTTAVYAMSEAWSVEYADTRDARRWLANTLDIPVSTISSVVGIVEKDPAFIGQASTSREGAPVNPCIIRYMIASIDLEDARLSCALDPDKLRIAREEISMAMCMGIGL